MLHAFEELIFLVDKDGTILEHRSGDPFKINNFPSKGLKQKIQDLVPTHVSQKISAGLQELQRGNNLFQIEFFIQSFAEKNWYEARLVPAMQGQVIVLLRNITKHKRSEELVKSQIKQLSAMREIDLSIVSGADLSQTLHLILDYVTKHLGVDAASVLLLNPQTYLLDFAAGIGFQTVALHHTHLQIGEGLAGLAALKRNIVHISNLQQSNTGLLRSQYLRTERFISYYAIPLIAREQVLGVLEIFHRSPLSANQTWRDFLQTLAGQASIAIDNAMMIKNLQRSNVELTLAYDKTIDGWSRALDLRDRETEDHTRRVTELTLRLAQKMDFPEADLIHIRRGSTLHDIGKVSIPDHILLKPAPLTSDEWAIMRRHPLIAEEILKPISYLAPALPIPRFHHEKWDGSGYPDGLAGEAIPLEARLFAFADVYDALTSNRPYRPAWTQTEALEYIQNNTGIHFDPNISPVFINMVIA